MKKRGISHVEIILSFIIFAGAVGFALYFFSPFDSNRLIDSSIDYVFREINRNAGVEVESYFVRIDCSKVIIPGSDCTAHLIQIGGFLFAINLPGIGTGRNPDGERSDGTPIDSKRTGDLIYVKPTSGIWTDTEVIIIRFSEEFSNDAIADGPHGEVGYEILSSKIGEYLSEKKLEQLKVDYTTDYATFKGASGFNIPNRVDFGFSVIFSDGNSIVAQRNIPDNIETYSITKRVEILRKYGGIEFADLTVTIW